MTTALGDYVVRLYFCEVMFSDESRECIDFDPLRVFGGVYSALGDVSTFTRWLERLEAVGCLDFDCILSHYVGF